MPSPSIDLFPGATLFPERAPKIATRIPRQANPQTPQVYIAGRKLTEPYSGLVISHEWPSAGIGGPVSAQFTLLLPPSKRPSWLIKGALAEVRFGLLSVLAGAVANTDWDSGTITIDAAAREGSTTACLTAAGLTSSTPDTVIDAAIGRGALTWKRPASISATALSDGDETAKLNSVAEMLSAYADEANARLYVDPSRRLLKGADPTTPEVFILPGSGELSWTTDQQATRVIGRWADTAGKLSTAIAGSGAIERLIDMTPKGPLTSDRATAILNAILAKASSGGWVDGLTLTAGQFIGAPHLASIADRVGRGLMVRLLGQQDPRTGRLPVRYVDFIVERSEWHVADGTITLTPRGMVASNFAAVLAAAGVQEAA